MFILINFIKVMSMDSKGFTLIEVILALFLLGIIAVTFLPIVNITLENIRLTNERHQMILLAESVIEQIKCFNYESTKNVYIFDMNLVDIVDAFSVSDEMNITLPMDRGNQRWNYTCNIYKNNVNERIWDITIVVSYDGEKRIKDVVLQAYMEKADKN